MATRLSVLFQGSSVEALDRLSSLKYAMGTTRAYLASNHHTGKLSNTVIITTTKLQPRGTAAS